MIILTWNLCRLSKHNKQKIIIVCDKSPSASGLRSLKPIDHIVAVLQAEFGQALLRLGLHALDDLLDVDLARVRLEELCNVLRVDAPRVLAEAHHPRQ